MMLKKNYLFSAGADTVFIREHKFARVFVADLDIFFIEHCRRIGIILLHTSGANESVAYRFHNLFSIFHQEHPFVITRHRCKFLAASAIIRKGTTISHSIVFTQIDVFRVIGFGGRWTLVTFVTTFAHFDIYEEIFFLYHQKTI